ncbi:MAG: YcaO-like family protein [Rhodospirillaceae bacterium]|nr:YcaO-like family protein [Rhodospirillaceae bacterium]
MNSAFRSQPGEVALHKVLRAISTLELESRVETVAATPGAAFVSLLHQGEPVAHGIGKGQCCDALTGAYFEALEHYALDLAAADATAPKTFKSSMALTRDPALTGDRAISLFAESEDIDLAVRRFTAIAGTDNILYPEFLINPRCMTGGTSFHGVERYSSNSGTAIGLGNDEAVLHGINEVIERDLLSRMLASGTFLERIPVGLIDPATLPLDMQRAFEATCKIVDSELALLLISQPDELPTFVALVMSEDDHPVWGAGTALCGLRAAQRAIDECAQSAHALAMRHDMREAQTGHRQRVAGLPALSRISSLHWSTFTAHVDLSPMTFAAAAQNIFPEESGKPLWSLASTLASTLAVARRSYSGIFGATIARFPEEIVVVQIVIPEADSFFLALSGVPVVPSIRHCRKTLDLVNTE